MVDLKFLKDCLSPQLVFFLSLCPTLVTTAFFGFHTFYLVKVNNSNEVKDLVYVHSMIWLLAFLTILSILFTAATIFIFFVLCKKKRFNFKIYQILVPCIVVLNIVLLIPYFYYNKMSERNVSSFLTEKVQEINSDGNSLSLDTMNNVQKYFDCCGYFGSGDYINATKENSCYKLGVVVPTKSFFQSNKIPPKPFLNTGCFEILLFHINRAIWTFFAYMLAISLLKIFILFAINLFIEEYNKPELPVEEPLMADNSQKQSEFQVEFQADSNQPVYQSTTQPNS